VRDNRGVYTRTSSPRSGVGEGRPNPALRILLLHDNLDLPAHDFLSQRPRKKCHVRWTCLSLHRGLLPRNEPVRSMLTLRAIIWQAPTVDCRLRKSAVASGCR